MATHSTLNPRDLRRRIRVYRNKAEELRTVAGQMHTAPAREAYHRMAETYDLLADRAETILGLQAQGLGAEKSG
jgi:hypothetical protein